jgi:hypothetical protein
MTSQKAPELGTFGPVPTRRRVRIGVLLALVLAVVALVTWGLVGQLPFAYEPVAGRGVAVVEDVPGPDDGPVCELDERYVDEEPDGLRADVLAAWERLAAAADEAGVHLCVQDGKRSRAQQQAEFDEAVEKFGTRELAARYVLPPEKSMHVKGSAVDVQPLSSAGWVEENGAALGWCRRYENEPWHFEYDAGYASGGCPALRPSATGT